MTWPTATVSTGNLDSDSDSPLSARADILSAVEKLNQMVAHVSAFAATLLDDADVAAARSTLGLGSIATQAASAVDVSGGVINNTPIGATTPSTGKFTALETTVIGSQVSPAVRIGASNVGWYTYGALGTSATMVRLSLNGAGYAAFGQGYCSFGEGAPLSNIYMYLVGTSASTSSTSYGAYNRVKYQTNGVKNIDVRFAQTTSLISDDGTARTFNTVFGQRMSGPDMTGLQTGSAVTTYRHHHTDDITDSRVLAASSYFSSMNAMSGVTRYGVNAVGTAPNYFGGPLIAGSAVVKRPTRSTASSGTTTLLASANTLVIDVATTMASRTIELPSTSIEDGMEITIATRSAITALTITGGTIYGAPTTLAAGGFCSFIYSSASAAWFRKG